MEALERNTPVEVPVVVVGSASGEDTTSSPARRERLVLAARPESALDQVMREVDHLAAPADLVLVSSSCRVPPRWLERLREAAHSDDTVATASPLSNAAGSAAQLPVAAGPEADGRIGVSALRAFPSLLIGGPACLYVRRPALELIGGMSPSHSTLESLIAALCEACAGAGMVNVVADDLFVSCVGATEGPDARPGGPLRDHDLGDERSVLQRALAVSRVAVRGLTVTIDARSLGPGAAAGGTQLYTLELALALAGTERAAVRVVVGPDVAIRTRRRLDETDGIQVVTYDEVIGGVELSEVVHRPQQVFTADDLALLRLLGRRLVITHQDLIAYHNPTYHESIETWEQYRRITRIALASADRVVFFSEHSKRAAEAEDLVAPERGDVVGAALGEPPPIVARAPAGVPADREFILCLGPDYRHKNRVFAIQLLAALRTEQSWPGLLVLAGTHVAHGSSRPEEAELLSADARVRGAVIDLGGVDEQERQWLLENARAVLVPSVVEGFGLVPLEAAQAGRPCLFAAQTSLREVLSGSLATLVPWDASSSAARARGLLTEGAQRADHIARLQTEATRWAWRELVDDLMTTYERALRGPHRAATVRVWQELERERYLVEVDRARQDVTRVLAHLGDRIPLASDEGPLTPHQQRGLLRVASRPALARTLLWPFGLLGSVQRPARSRDQK